MSAIAIILVFVGGAATGGLLTLLFGDAVVRRIANSKMVLPPILMPRLMRGGIYRSAGADLPLPLLSDGKLENGLVHGIYMPAHKQVEFWRKQSRRKFWGFTDADFQEALDTIPEWPEKNTVAVVLVPYLETTKKTVLALASLAERCNKRLSSGFQFSVPGEHVHGKLDKPGLRWEIIDLHANRELSFMEVLLKDDQTELPDAGIIAAAVVHTEWVRRMDGDDVPFVWLSGYCKQSSDTAPALWQELVETKLLTIARLCRFLAWHREFTPSLEWAVPVFYQRGVG